MQDFKLSNKYHRRIYITMVSTMVEPRGAGTAPGAGAPTVVETGGAGTTPAAGAYNHQMLK